jgi:hypothetical protein
MIGMSLKLHPEFKAVDGFALKQKAAEVKPAEGFSFWDLLDVVNPLQHIPVVGTVYRAVTGDKISNFSRIAGGAVFGGLAGAAVGLVNTVAVQEAGKDIGELAMSKLGFGAASEPEKTKKQTPIIEVHPLAENVEQPAALPESEDIGKIAPLNDFTQNVAENKVPDAMMQAMAKYEAMQGLLSHQEEKEVASSDDESKAKEFRRSLRHYGAL